ncbi:MAG: GHMP kinase [Planctomycetes bacterium]|nr:GHMP kinase [Planctomycetota bacterium]
METLVPDDAGRPSGRTRQMQCPWQDDILLEAARDENEFFRYCAGVAYEIKRRKKLSAGVDIRITEMELPLKKGVSSSAAVCILVAKAFNEIYGLNLFPNELMELSYLGERLTGSQCGRMDQACIYGNVPVLLVFEKGKDVRIEPIFLRDDIFMFYVDLAGTKDTVKILEDLNHAFLKDEDLQDAFGDLNEETVRQAFQMIQAGRAEGLGALMTQAQSRFDQSVAKHCCELEASLLHDVLSLADIQSHVFGCKGVGSQGDGTAQFVARSEDDCSKAMAKITQAFPTMRCFPLTIRSTSSDTRSPERNVRSLSEDA